MQPWRTPFPIWNQSVVPRPVLTVASWPADRFLRRQDRWSGIPISLRIFHSLLWSTQSKALAQSVKRSRCFSGTLVLFRWSHRCWQFDLWLHKSLTKRAELPPEAWTCLSQDDFCLGERWWEERVRRCGLDSDSKPTVLTSHSQSPVMLRVSLGLSCMHAELLSHVWLLVTPWTIALQAPLSMEFPRQEYWRGLPCPPPGHLRDPGVEPKSLAASALTYGFFTAQPPGSLACSDAQSCLILATPRST